MPGLRSLGVAVCCAWLFLVAGGCRFGLGNPDSGAMPCNTGADCPGTASCIEHVCIESPLHDMAVPDLLTAPDLSAAGRDAFGSNCDLGCCQGLKRCGDRCIPNVWCCTAIDCAADGQTCQPDGSCRCPDGFKRCLTVCIAITDCCTNDDCPSKICDRGQCTVPSCDDGVPNGSEPDVDCGGACPACGVDRGCAIATDCRSNVCDKGTCREPGFTRASCGGGAWPGFVVAGDLDHDGRQDLVALGFDGARAGSHTASVLLGRGDGTFDSVGSYPAGHGPVHAALGDLDGDQRLDLVVADSLAGGISVLRGRGDGSFGAPDAYRAMAGTRFVVIADLNGDTRLDVVAASETSGTLQTFLGNGNGTLKAATSTFPWLTRPRALAVADLNSDGRLDLVALFAGRPRSQEIAALRFENGGVGVFLQKPFGALDPRYTPAPGPGLTTLVARDLDSDQILDVLLGGAAVATRILPGRNDGTFAAATMLDVVGGQALALADLDGNGRADLVTSSGIQLGGLKGAFAKPIPFVGASPLIASLATADFNNDGKLDLAWPEGARDSVHVLLCNGDGSCADPGQIPRAASDTDVALLVPRALTLADLDGDAHQDVIVAGGATASGGPALRVQLANADGSLRGPSRYPIGLADPTALVADDFTGDGRIDVVAGSDADATVWLFPGDGKGALGKPSMFFTGVFTLALQSVDLDGDHDSDLVAIVPGGAVRAWRSNNDGTFQPPIRLQVGQGACCLSVADWNSDGWLDVITANRLSRDLSFVMGTGLDGNGVPTFAPAVSVVPAGPAVEPIAMAIADVSQDARPDVVLASAGARAVTWYLSTTPRGGAPSLGNPTSRPLLAGPIGLLPNVNGGNGALAVLQDDDALSLLASPLAAGSVRTTYPVGAGAVAVAAGRLNGDLVLDLVTADRAGHTITVLLSK